MKKTMLVIALLALVAVPAMASGPLGQVQFPDSDVYVIRSLPSFNIAVGDRTELVTCNAELRLHTGQPYVAADGTRRVDLEILDWKADGRSELLGGEIHFRMEQGREAREPSYVKSFQAWNAAAPQDFPAHAQFAVPYEVETPFGKVSGLFGLTSGSINQFPPRGAVFTMEKGDTAEIMAALMPEPLSALSTAGEITPVSVTVRPAACLCPDIEVAGTGGGR